MKTTNPLPPIELTVESIGFEGVAIAKHNGQTVFVKGGLPGDTVLATPRRNRKSYIEATINTIIKPSPHRKAPFCQYFGHCGGCTWQCLDYKQQLLWKRQHVIDAYQRIGKLNIDLKTVHATVPATQTLHYRNKMDFSFSSRRWFVSPTDAAENKQLIDNNIATDVVDNSITKCNEKQASLFALGLHVPGSFDKVIDIEECKIQPEIWNEVLLGFRAKALELNVLPHNHRAQSGFLKGLTLRQSLATSQMMCILTTDKPEPTGTQNNEFVAENQTKLIKWFRYELMNLFPTIVSTVWCINSQNSVNVGTIQFVEGADYMLDKILGLNYRVSPLSFFQTNSYQLDTLITLVLQAAKPTPNDVVWDLYCGTGSITLPTAAKCRHIYGAELNEAAIQDANQNAQLNGITNVTFYAEDLHSKKPTLLASLPNPNLIIIDPPRSGLHPNVVKTILNTMPPRLVYVSCNPTTQARDLAELLTKYELVAATPIDMFPHTYHIEVVTELRKRND